MSNQDLLSKFSSALSAAKTVFVVLPSDPKFDEVASGLSLYLSLKEQGKNISIACLTPMAVKFSSLVGLDKVKPFFDGKKENLIVSFDYKEEKVDKVSYSIEGDKFNLVIKPKEGELPLETSNVVFSYSGGKPDLIITINYSSLEEIKKLSRTEADKITSDLIVSIGYFENDEPAFIKLIDKNIASVSELATGILSRLNLPLENDIASNLLSGIEEASRMFSSNRVNSNTFEMAALCLKNKARRRVFSVSQADGIRAERKEERQEKVGQEQKDQEFKFPKKETEKPQKVEPQEGEETPSPDWLEPKIYKGNTKL